MTDREPHISTSAGRGRRLTRLLALAFLCGAAGAAGVSKANAFEIFGFKLFGSDDEDADIVDPLNYSVAVELTPPDKDLQEKLEKASVLVQDADRPVSGSLGLLARARGDREQLVAALYAEARYDGVVTVLIDGKSIDDLPPDAEFDRQGTVPVTIRIAPGQVFVLGGTTLKGDAADIAPERFGLLAGGNAASTAVLRAEAEVVRALKEEGRPLAAISGREVVADHATTTLDVVLSVAAGPIATYGPVTVTGVTSMDEDFTRYMTGLEPGKTYSPKDIDDARERLQALGVFSSVSVQEATKLAPDGTIPIEVEVSERKLRYYGVGASYSNTDGLGLEGYWGHRNLFGQAEKLRIEGSISGIGATDSYSDLGQLNYNAAILFEKPGVIGPDSKFFARVDTVFEHPDAYDRLSVGGSAGLSYELSESQTVSAEAKIEYSDISDYYHPDGQRHLLVSLPVQYVLDSRDNKLDPKKGFRTLAFVEPSYDILTGAAFVKVKGDASAYQLLDEAGRFILAGRVSAGTIAGATLEDVPADRRFYLGGGGSVRGYAYQGIGPKDPDGNPTGGLSYVETSIEMRIGVTETLGIVPFIDGGTVSATEAPDFADMQFGAGIGVRYLTPFGPLRVDFAVPLDRGPGDPSFGIYAGVGQSF